MDYYKKYLKYKIKYNKLKYFGGVTKPVLTITDNTRTISFDLTNELGYEKIEEFYYKCDELIIKKIIIAPEFIHTYEWLNSHIKNYTFINNYITDSNEERKKIWLKNIKNIETKITVESDVFDILYYMLNHSVPEIEKKYAVIVQKKQFNEIDISQIHTYDIIDLSNIKSITEIPDCYLLINTVELLISFITSILSAYLTNTQSDIKYRIEEISEYFKTPAEIISTYNSEKKQIFEYFTQLKTIITNIKTYIINKLFIDKSIRKGAGATENSGIIYFNEKYYFYKEILSIKHNTPLHYFIKNILSAYNFINNINNVYFNEVHEYNGEKYNITIIKSYNVMILSRNKEYINFGYIMDIVKGENLEELYKIDKEYVKEKLSLISTAVSNLLRKLTSMKIAVNDPNPNNIMWDKETNTLTLIDVVPQMFGKSESIILESNTNSIDQFLLPLYI
jgi:hypothetical protein